ncbi:MAG: hypothetical protein J0I12_28290 [Candidatus Eremiobacteraeota bacterium]|nr:hypothetical protein [Candidatus Eremiobacteraeota bacterium]
MITLPVSFTLLCLFVMIGFAFLPPKIPTVLRNIFLQVAFGFVIYFAMGEANFTLPNGLPMSGLAGGYMMADPAIPVFNKYALGLLAPVLGIVFSILVGIVRFVLARKKTQKGDD